MATNIPYKVIAIWTHLDNQHVEGAVGRFVPIKQLYTTKSSKVLYSHFSALDSNLCMLPPFDKNLISVTMQVQCIDRMYQEDSLTYRKY